MRYDIATINCCPNELHFHWLSFFRYAIYSLFSTLTPFRLNLFTTFQKSPWQLLIYASLLRALKVWDFQAALDPNTKEEKLCLWTSVVSVSVFSDLHFKWRFYWDFMAGRQIKTLYDWSLQQHTGSIWGLQFDDSQIVSSSIDDTMVIWDFLDVPDHLNYPQLKCTKKIIPKKTKTLKKVDWFCRFL